jgi:hypothetical protein
MTIYVLYSADYEVFLGGNYCSEKEVLIDPTNDLLDFCDRLEIPVTLFADVFSILRYKEKNLPGFPEMAERQLKDAIRRGHDVQSHVHPHWNFTEIEGNVYRVSPGFFLLGNLDPDKEMLYEKVRQFLVISRHYLKSLLSPVDDQYQCIAFRAGGYGLQPHPDVIIRALISAGFLIDSSIVPGYTYKSNVNTIDFSQVPLLANYYLSGNLTMPSKNSTGIFEIPIGACKFDFITNSVCQGNILCRVLKNKMLYHKNGHEKQRGYSIQQTRSGHKDAFVNNFVQFFFKRFYFLDCTTSEEKMFKCTKKYLSSVEDDKDIFFCFNMHPKIMTGNHFAALERYHASLQSYYQDEISAISFQEAARMLALKKS